jgi:hypothetical protein
VRVYCVNLTRSLTFSAAYQADIPMFGRDEFVASGLVNLGLFPCSPYDPTVAIMTRALEVFRVMRLRCPRLGIQPYVRALCDLHGVHSNAPALLYIF